ncbi:MAG: hypothetical protein ABIQ31_15160 [Ferruginibacter sp.]
MFFITFTCHQWMPLIEKINGCDVVHNWLDFLKSNGHYINGFVIMPDHIHVLISFINASKSINTIKGMAKD